MYPVWNGGQNVPAEVPMYGWPNVINGFSTTNFHHVLSSTTPTTQQHQTWDSIHPIYYSMTETSVPTVYPNYCATFGEEYVPVYTPPTNYYVPFQGNSVPEPPLNQFATSVQDNVPPETNNTHQEYFDKPTQNIENSQQTTTEYVVQNGDDRNKKEEKRTIKYRAKEGYIVEELVDSDIENDTINLSIERECQKSKPLRNENIK